MNTCLVSFQQPFLEAGHLLKEVSWYVSKVLAFVDDGIHCADLFSAVCDRRGCPAEADAVGGGKFARGAIQGARVPPAGRETAAATPPHHIISAGQALFALSFPPLLWSDARQTTASTTYCLFLDSLREAALCRLTSHAVPPCSQHWPQ